MTEQTITDTAQGADEVQAQGADPQAQGADSRAAQGAGEDSGGSVEALTRKIADLEKDNRAYRQREAKREAAEKSQTEAEATESQKLASRIQELERQLDERQKREQEQSLRLSTITTAQKLGYRNPELAHRILDREAITFAEDGSPTNVEEQLRELAKSDPYLLAATDFGGGPRGTSPAAKSTDMNTLIRKAAGR